MKKTHTLYQNLTPSALNQRIETGDGVLSIQNVTIDGNNVTIGRYRVCYNGIIVESEEPITINTEESTYIVITNIVPLQHVAPYVYASNAREGVVLMERLGNGWFTRTLGNVAPTRTSWNRTYDDEKVYINILPGVYANGIIVHSPISFAFTSEEPAILQDFLSVGTEYFITPDSQTIDPIHSFSVYKNIYAYVTDTSVVINNHTLSVSGVSAVSVCPYGENYARYCYAVGQDLIHGTIHLTTGATTSSSIHFDSNIQKLQIVENGLCFIVLDSGTFLYGALSSVFTPLRTGTCFHVTVDENTGKICYSDIDGKIYIDFQHIGQSSKRFACIDGQLLFYDEFGFTFQNTQYPLGGITYIAQVFPGIVGIISDTIYFYDINKKEITYMGPILGGGGGVGGDAGPIGGVGGVGGPLFFVHDGTEIFLYTETQRTRLTIPVLKDEAISKYGSKTHNIDFDRQLINIHSNTKIYVTSTVDEVNMGRMEMIPSVSVDPSRPLVTGLSVYDGDYILDTYTNPVRVLRVDPDGAFLCQSSTIPVLDVQLVSGDIEIHGGTYNTINVCAVNSIIIGATIDTLFIQFARNVLFIGCNITNLINENQLNTYKVLSSKHSDLEGNSLPECHPASAISYTGGNYNINGGEFPYSYWNNTQDFMRGTPENFVCLTKYEGGIYNHAYYYPNIMSFYPWDTYMISLEIESAIRTSLSSSGTRKDLFLIEKTGSGSPTLIAHNVDFTDDANSILLAGHTSPPSGVNDLIDFVIGETSNPWDIRFAALDVANLLYSSRIWITIRPLHV